MAQWRPITFALLVLAVALLAVWGCMGLTQHAIIALDKWGDAAPEKKQVSGLLTQGAMMSGHADLAAQNLADATGDWSDASKQQARDVRAMLAASGRALDGITGDTVALHSELDALQQTTIAATGFTEALTADAKTADKTIAAAQPLLASYTAAGDSLNDLLKRKAIGDTLDHLAGITANADGILADGKKVADKTTADFLRPVPWYMQPIKKSSDLLDIAAALARHTP